jgi:RES domain-containing protein
MVVFRIADGRYKIYDPTGAMLRGGRWNSIGVPVIYAAESFAGAMLEVLVHANASRPPRHHQLVRITVPAGTSVETLPAIALPGWNQDDGLVSRAFGDQWVREARSAVLIVPGVITEGRENNVVINPAHPDFHKILPGPQEAIRWDDRLFQSSEFR